MSNDLESKAAGQQWFGIILCALLAAVIGTSLGFASQALLPVKAYAILPKANPKKPEANKLPKIFWLKQTSSKEIGQATAREKEIRAGLVASLNDKEINQWMSRVFGKDATQPTEDFDAKLGIPFVRIGGQLPGTEKENILTVTMPFKLKVGSLPVSEVPLQFTARPIFDGTKTTWDIYDAHMGHARIPESMADETVMKAIDEVAGTQQGAKEIKHLLTAYQRVLILDGKLVLQAPMKIRPVEEVVPPPAKAGVKPVVPTAPTPAEKTPAVA